MSDPRLNAALTTEPQFWMVFGVIAGGLITFGALLWATRNGDRKARRDK